MSINKLIFITAIFSALLPMSSLAGTKEAIANAESKEASSDTWDKLVPAWDNVSNKLIDFVGEQKQKLITNLAFAAVAADLCEGLALDKEKFKAEFDSFNDADYKALSPADKAEFGPKLMTFFGVYVGLLTAEGILEKPAFCGYAVDMQAKGKEEGKYLTTTKIESK
jgi:hypothetical protein